MKATPFLTYIMNFMQFMYIYSLQYLSIRFNLVKLHLHGGLTTAARSKRDRPTMKLPAKKEGSGSRRDPRPRDSLLVRACIEPAPSS